MGGSTMKPAQRLARWRALWWGAMARTANAIAGPRHPVTVAAVDQAHAALDGLHLCLDCRFARIRPMEPWRCRHPSSLYQPPQSPVTGRIDAPYLLTCDSARTTTLARDPCGLAGRHWAPRYPEQDASGDPEAQNLTY
jgi:hypothetical protein